MSYVFRKKASDEENKIPAERPVTEADSIFKLGLQAFMFHVWSSATGLY